MLLHRTGLPLIKRSCDGRGRLCGGCRAAVVAVAMKLEVGMLPRQVHYRFSSLDGDVLTFHARPSVRMSRGRGWQECSNATALHVVVRVEAVCSPNGVVRVAANMEVGQTAAYGSAKEYIRLSWPHTYSTCKRPQQGRGVREGWVASRGEDR